MSELDYPENFLKGAPNFDAFDSENNVMTYDAWGHWEASDTMEGFEESSINWQDDDGALQELRLKMTEKTGEKRSQFIGCFLFSTEELRKCVKRYEKLLAFGRCPLAENPYHGNIYRKKGMTRQITLTITSLLGNAFLRFIDFSKES